VSNRSLPAHPDLGQLKLQARELRRDHRNGDPSAAARVLAHHPRLRDRALREALDAPLKLADAQLVIAREYGFDKWSALKHHVEVADRWAQISPHPRFTAALAAFDAGDLNRLQALIATDPSLLRARGHLEAPLGYFSAATLLHHVAGNPFRSPLPANVVEIARFLIDAGSDVNAETLDPKRVTTTMGLLITSAHASQIGVSGPLIELLLRNGAELNLHAPGVLDTPLANHAPRAAEKMIELGAKADACAAAALGRMELLRDCFAGDGALKSSVHRHGQRLSARDTIGLALLFAYANERQEAVDLLLEKDGNWNMTGVNNGTALHRAAGSGDLVMVKRLVVLGADLNDRNNPFHATPLSWAEHAKAVAVSEWIRGHCPVDIHDAVGFGLLDHVRSRIDEDRGCVDRTLDQWEIPHSTPLHHAAYYARHEIAKLLLGHGAQSNTLAGDGRTALDMAEARGAAEVANLLREHGGVHATSV
jgi:ankyrin repeat protein